jgi:hypothetical protein
MNQLERIKKETFHIDQNRCQFLGVEVLTYDKFSKDVKYNRLPELGAQIIRNGVNISQELDKVVVVINYDGRWIVAVLAVNLKTLYIVDFLSPHLGGLKNQDLYEIMKQIIDKELGTGFEGLEFFAGLKLKYISDCGIYALNFVYKCRSNEYVENIQVKPIDKDPFRKQLIWLLLKRNELPRSKVQFSLPSLKEKILEKNESEDSSLNMSREAYQLPKVKSLQVESKVPNLLFSEDNEPEHISNNPSLLASQFDLDLSPIAKGPPVNDFCDVKDIVELKIFNPNEIQGYSPKKRLIRKPKELASPERQQTKSTKNEFPSIQTFSNSQSPKKGQTMPNLDLERNHHFPGKTLSVPNLDKDGLEFLERDNNKKLSLLQQASQADSPGLKYGNSGSNKLLGGLFSNKYHSSNNELQIMKGLTSTKSLTQSHQRLPPINETEQKQGTWSPKKSNTLVANIPFYTVDQTKVLITQHGSSKNHSDYLEQLKNILDSKDNDDEEIENEISKEDIIELRRIKRKMEGKRKIKLMKNHLNNLLKNGIASPVKVGLRSVRMANQ